MDRGAGRGRPRQGRGPMRPRRCSARRTSPGSNCSARSTASIAADGRLAIVDYKTGKAPSQGGRGRVSRLQLGLLALIAGGAASRASGASRRPSNIGRSPRTKDRFGKRRRGRQGGRTGRLPRCNALRRGRRQISDRERAVHGQIHPGHAPYGDYDQLMRLEEWYGRDGASPSVPAALRLLDLGRIEQRRDDRRRADADRDARLDQFGPPSSSGLLSSLIRSSQACLALVPIRKRALGKRRRPCMRRRLKPSPLEGAQAAASDPLAHAALSASAGTGKTQVLTARVLRLLLRGRAVGDPVPDLHQGRRRGNGQPHRGAWRTGCECPTWRCARTCSRSART